MAYELVSPSEGGKACVFVIQGGVAASDSVSPSKGYTASRPFIPSERAVVSVSRTVHDI